MTQKLTCSVAFSSVLRYVFFLVSFLDDKRKVIKYANFSKSLRQILLGIG
jgi:hypothetical protein